MRIDRNPFYINRLSVIPLDDYKRRYPNCTKARRFSIFENQDYKCVTCGAEGIAVVIYRVKRQIQRDVLALTVDGQEVMLTLDHIKPKAKGGRDNIENLQTMCFPCNNDKADKEIV